jgi:prepilin-type N-terminal cleavage/methylation domain-containing protein
VERRSGFTLIELLIAVAVLGIVSVYMFESFAKNQQAYTVIDQLSESQQNLRAIGDLIERDVRHGGMMVPEGAAACGVDNDAGSDLLYVSDAAALDPQDDVATYDGVSISVATQVVVGNQSFNVSGHVLEPAPSRPAYDTTGDGAADSDFVVDGGVIVMDLLNPGRGTACGRVSAVNVIAGTLGVEIRSPLLAATAAAAQLVAVPAHEFRIVGERLFRDGVVLAGGVEDLQVAWFLDADGDNRIDANEVHGDGTGPDYAAAAQDAAQIRELRFNLVTRTRAEDREWSLGRPQAMENRTAVVANDGFRRRVYTSTVMMRNVGSRAL